MNTTLSILIGIAVVVLVVVRQTRTQQVRTSSAARLVAILGAIGLVETVGAAQGHHVGTADVGIVLAGLVLGAAFGVVRAYTMQVWRDPSGVAWQRGSWLTVVLWVASIGSHLALTYADQSEAAQALSSASILLFVAVSIGTQRELVRLRARHTHPVRTSTPFAAMPR